MIILVIVAYLFGVLSMHSLIKLKKVSEKNFNKYDYFAIYCPIINTIMGIVILGSVINVYREKENEDEDE